MGNTKQETILQHLTTLKALDREVRAAIDRQQKDDRLSQQQDTAHLLERIEGTLAQQSERLETRIDALDGGSAVAEIKQRVGQLLGFAEGLWHDLSKRPVSHALRDDYAALNLLAIHYTMLHAAALALDDRTTADLAFQNLRELTPMVVEISQAMPLVVVAELGQEHRGIDPAVATAAVRTTHAAWQREPAKVS